MYSLIAMLTMLIDHVGLTFFPEDITWRIVGRIAFPLYCWFIVQGFQYTRNVERYMVRLFGLAVLSQLPFQLMIQIPNYSNAIFTLLTGLVALYAAEKIPNMTGKVIVLFAAIVLAMELHMDYGLYGVILILIYRYAEGWMKLVWHGLLEIVFVVFFFWSPIQTFSLFATLMIVFPLPNRIRLFVPKWVYRLFYPAHMTAIWGVQKFIS